MVVWDWKLMRAGKSSYYNVAGEKQGCLHWTRKTIAPSLIRGKADVCRWFVGCFTCGIGQHFQQYTALYIYLLDLYSCVE